MCFTLICAQTVLIEPHGQQMLPWRDTMFTLLSSAAAHHCGCTRGICRCLRPVDLVRQFRQRPMRRRRFLLSFWSAYQLHSNGFPAVVQAWCCTECQDKTWCSVARADTSWPLSEWLCCSQNCYGRIGSTEPISMACLC
jgi:hypothetical protein